MRKLIARVFDYSLDGVIATEGTEFFQFCRDLPDDPEEDVRGSEFYAGTSPYRLNHYVHLLAQSGRSDKACHKAEDVRYPPPDYRSILHRHRSSLSVVPLRYTCR